MFICLFICLQFHIPNIKFFATTATTMDTENKLKQLLKQYNLEKFYAKLEEEGYDCIADVRDIGDAELKEYGFKAGHIKKFRRAIAENIESGDLSSSMHSAPSTPAPPVKKAPAPPSRMRRSSSIQAGKYTISLYDNEKKSSGKTSIRRCTKKGKSKGYAAKIGKKGDKALQLERRVLEFLSEQPGHEDSIVCYEEWEDELCDPKSGEPTGESALIMELGDGIDDNTGNLSEQIKEYFSRFNYSEKLNIAEELLKCFEFIHKFGIVHGDVKRKF